MDADKWKRKSKPMNYGYGIDYGGFIKLTVRTDKITVYWQITKAFRDGWTERIFSKTDRGYEDALRLYDRL
jgi:hypothetical protein